MDKLVSFLLIFKDVAVYVRNCIETHSNLIVAIATAAIAFFTWTLYCATRKLWKASQEQSRDMKTSLKIARDAADAAKKSADAFQASNRARLFVRVERDSPPKGQPIKEGHNQVRIIIINEGQSLAIITELNWHVGVMNNQEIDDKISEFTTSMIQYGHITISSGSREERIFEYSITTSDLQKINEVTAYYVCLGKIRYKDVFRQVWGPITFCWKDDGDNFAPDPERNDHA